MASMMQTMHDPTYRARLEAKMGALKEDPELADVMQQLESGGPAAMMKCASPLHKPPLPLLLKGRMGVPVASATLFETP